VVSAATLTTPVPLLLAPLAVWRIAVGRTPRERAVPFVYTVGLAVQVAAMFVAPDPVEALEFRPVEIAGGYVARVAGMLPVGNRWLPEAWRLSGWWFAIIAVTVEVILLLRAASKGDRNDRTLIIGTVGLSIVVFGSVVSGRGISALLVPGGDAADLTGARYTFVPLLLLTSAVVVAFEVLCRSAGRGAGRIAASVGLTVLTALVFANLSFTRAGGPTWGTQLHRARERCAAGSPEVMRIPITPVGAFVEVTCRQLAEEAASGPPIGDT
jgi:hypothetical protein